MIPDHTGKKFESVPLNTSQDVEKGAQGAEEKVEKKRPLTYFVTLTSGVSWPQWALMGAVTFFMWFVILTLIGSTSYSCESSDVPAVVVLPPSQVINADTQNVFFTLMGQDDLSEDDIKPVAKEAQGVEEMKPSFPLGNRPIGEPMSQDDLSKLLSLAPGWHEKEGVYVAEPITFTNFGSLDDKSEDDNFASSFLNKGIVSRNDEVLEEKALANKKEESKEEDEEKIVEAFVGELLKEMNASLYGSEGGKSLSRGDKAEDVQRSSEESIAGKSKGQLIDHVDPMFLTIPIQPYYVSPKELKLNWLGALQACWARDMELVSIQDNEENQQVVDYIEKSLADGEDDDFWTAGTNLWVQDRAEFHWATTGEKFNFTKWHHGNPSSPMADNQNCVQITKSLDSRTQGTFMWNDYGCHYKTRFVCEDPMRYLHS